MTRPEYDADPQEWIDYLNDATERQEAVIIDMGELPKATRRELYHRFAVVNPFLRGEIIDE